jgi:peptidyl-prolyl cis-trans isomerase C
MSTVTVSHILVPTLDLANELYTSLVSGSDFIDLAKTHSTCPSGASGGNLGAFGRGAMVKPFEDTAFGLDVGSISDPVQTQFGYHLIYRTN